MKFKTTLGVDLTIHAVIEAEDIDEAQAKAEDIMEQLSSEEPDVTLVALPIAFAVVNDDGSVTVN